MTGEISNKNTSRLSWFSPSVVLACCLLISLTFSVYLFVTKPVLRRESSTRTQPDFERFARSVTVKLLDSSYLNYEKNMLSLLEDGELERGLVASLQRKQLLPGSAQEVGKRAKALTEAGELTCVSVEKVVMETGEAMGGVPIKVVGTIAKNSNAGPEQREFRIKYLMFSRPDRPAKERIPQSTGWDALQVIDVQDQSVLPVLKPLSKLE